MGMGFAPTWLRQVSPPPASRDHFDHWVAAILMIFLKINLPKFVQFKQY